MSLFRRGGFRSGPTGVAPKTRTRPWVKAALLTASAMVPVATLAQAPLNDHPVRLGWFETANVYHEGTLELNVGTSQTNSATGAGTGNQLYFGGGQYALTDRLSFGIDAQSYQDPVLNPINGAFPEFIINNLAFWAKYQIYNDQKLSFAAQVSVEHAFRMEAPLFGGRNENVIFGSIKAPVSYAVSDTLQLHLTPSVTVMPDTLGGMPFYGTVAMLGAGVSYKPTDRLAFYGAVDVPVSGGNTISNTAAFVQAPVWIVGGRFNVTPKIALDGFVTNGVGITPAMSMMTHWPDGDDILVGAWLTWTPGAKRPDSYRGVPAPVTARQVQQQSHGFTLTSASTLEPGVFETSLWYGSGESSGVGISWSPDQDGQLDFFLENFSDTGSADPMLVPTTSVRYMFGPKLRVLDQNNGDPFSLAGRALFGRQIDENSGVGVFYLEAAASYQVNDRLTLNMNPQVTAFGNTEIAAVGFGVNYEVFDGLELIAEATAVGLDASDPTWALGAQYNLADSGFAVDLHASNAIGRQGIGTLVAQDEVKVSLGITKTFDASGWR